MNDVIGLPQDDLLCGEDSEILEAAASSEKSLDEVHSHVGYLPAKEDEESTVDADMKERKTVVKELCSLDSLLSVRVLISYFLVLTAVCGALVKYDTFINVK